MIEKSPVLILAGSAKSSVCFSLTCKKTSLRSSSNNNNDLDLLQDEIISLREKTVGMVEVCIIDVLAYLLSEKNFIRVQFKYHPVLFL